MRNANEHAGFTPPADRPLGCERRTAAVAELIASAALALSTLAVITVMSVGIAHANPVDGVIGHEGSVFAMALLLGLIFLGLSGLGLAGQRMKKR